VTAQPRALPNLVPVLVERWRALVAEFEGLASNPNAEPGERANWTKRAAIYTPYSVRSR
jgi:hypothetical protein